VIKFTQDDAHIFCTEEQLEEEIANVIELTEKIYKKFGLEFDHVELSTRPEKRIGSDKIWDKTEKALENVTPRVEVKPRRRAGAVQLVPRVLRTGERSKAPALRWILEACDKRSGQPMVNKLKNEIIEAYKKTGYAIRKKDELHKVAIANAMYAKKPQSVINAVTQITP
jgi:hypothetical protein